MSNVDFKKGLSEEKLQNVNFQDGQILFNVDTGALYIDAAESTKDNKRTKVTDPELKARIENLEQNGLTGEYLDKQNPTGSGSLSLNRLENSTVGNYSVAIGDRTLASGKGSTAEGCLTEATGNQSHAEGDGTKATAIGSHSEGGYSVKQDGTKVFTTSSGNYAHAEGAGSAAEGDGSHAEGVQTLSTARGSHAEGNNTEAKAEGAHSEGVFSKATNTAAHSEGYDTEASGYAAHTEGLETKAQGNYSHAEGTGTIAQWHNQHVQGRYNEELTEEIAKTLAHVVGGGTYNDGNPIRKNIHTLDWNGNADFAGDVTATKEDGTKVSLIDVAENMNTDIEWNDINNKPEIPTKTSELTNDSNFVALDNGKVPSSALPSYVDDVIEGYLHDSKFYSDSKFTTEIIGESGKIYIDLDTNKTYRWSGSAFAIVSETLALGETASTAFYGDKGKVAYEHSQSTHAPVNAEKNIIVGIQKNGKDLSVNPDTRKVDIDVPTKLSDLVNDKGFITEAESGNSILNTTSGKNISLTDGSDNKLPEFGLYGNMKQYTTTGKNFYDVINTNLTNSYSKMEKTNNSLRVYSTTANTYVSVGKYVDYSKMQAGKTYTFSAYVTITKGVGRLTLRGGTGQIRLGTGDITSNGWHKFTFVLPQEDGLYFSFFATMGTSEIGDITYSNIQVEEGDTRTEYEPYTGYIASPNPDYPQEIEVSGASGNVVVTSCGKNILNHNILTQEINGLNITVNDDKTILVNGQATENTGAHYSIYLNKGTYIFSSSPYTENADCAAVIQPTKNNVAYTTIWDFGRGGEKFTIDEDNTLVWLNLARIVKGYTANNVLFKPMIRKCDENGNPIGDDTYEPYQETAATIATPNGLASIPVESDGNYTDDNGQQWVCNEIVKYADGSGEKIQRIKKVIYDGTNMKFSAKSSSTTNNIFYSDSTTMDFKMPLLSEETPRLISSHFTRDTANNGHGYNSTYPCIYASISYPNIYLGFGADSEITTVNLANEWLKSNNVTVYYELAEPIHTPLTSKEIAEIEKLQTFSPITNITNDFNCEMSISYFKNTLDGNLVADITDGTLKTKTITTGIDVNTLKTTGIYHIKTQECTNVPTANHATLFVDFTVGTPYQIFTPDSNNTCDYKRIYNNSSDTWGTWTKRDFTDHNNTFRLDTNGIEIPQGTDLNNLTTPGNYFSGHSGHAQTLVNCPIKHSGFRLLVLHGYGASATAQLIISYGNDVRYRAYESSNSKWSEWISLTDRVDAFPASSYDCNTLYDAGLYSIKAGKNCPSGNSAYGMLLVMPYRNIRGNTIPDFGAQIFLPNGDDSKANSIFFRTSLANTWNSWVELSNNGSAGNGGYPPYYAGTCSTAASTAAKTVSISGFELKVGAIVHIKFTNTNKASTPTLNVTSTGAKAIKHMNGKAFTYLDSETEYNKFIYDGTNWIWIGSENLLLDSNSSSYNGVKMRNGSLVKTEYYGYLGASNDKFTAVYADSYYDIHNLQILPPQPVVRGDFYVPYEFYCDISNYEGYYKIISGSMESIPGSCSGCYCSTYDKMQAFFIIRIIGYEISGNDYEPFVYEVLLSTKKYYECGTGSTYSNVKTITTPNGNSFTIGLAYINLTSCGYITGTPKIRINNCSSNIHFSEIDLMP